MPSLWNRVVLPFSVFCFSWQSAYWIFIACFGFFPHVRQPLCLAGSFLIFLLELSPVMETLCASLSLKICIKYRIRRHLLFIVWITVLSACQKAFHPFKELDSTWFLFNQFWTFWGFYRERSQEGSDLQFSVRNLERWTWGAPLEQRCMNGTRDATACVTSPRWTGPWMWCCWR